MWVYIDDLKWEHGQCLKKWREIRVSTRVIKMSWDKNIEREHKYMAIIALIGLMIDIDSDFMFKMNIDDILQIKHWK